jgi:hypothetical protein
LRSCIARLTLLWAFLPYFLAIASLLLRFWHYDSGPACGL